MFAAPIGNIVTNSITHQARTLQVALGLILREKSLISQLHKCNVTCSYDKVLRFKAAAASAARKPSKLRRIKDGASKLVQAVADNFDANISSTNGLRSTHVLALLITQVQSRAHLMFLYLMKDPPKSV